MDPDLTSAHAALRQLEARLRAQHGACRIEVQLEVEGDTVQVRGAVLVDRLRGPVCAAVQEQLPPGYRVEDHLAVVQGGPWYALPQTCRLRSGHAGGSDVTVLYPGDGPVEVLAEVGAARLVRDRCGTAGWTSAALGEPVNAPRLPNPRSRDPSDFVHAVRTYVGVSYRLGGTDRTAIDCSGLVQRAAWDALSIALPRNSRDLWGLGSSPGRPPEGLGHLVFVWTAGESLCHVGVVTPDAVVHASLSRQAVVSDPTERFYAAAERVDHLRFEALIDLGLRSAGGPNILAAGVRLGRPSGA